MACIVICAIAAHSDIRTYRIPNWLTAAGAIFGLTANTLIASLSEGVNGLMAASAASIAGMLVLFLVFLGLRALRFVGMGDVKLMAAVGALLAWPLAIWALVYVALCGGILGIIFSLSKGEFQSVLSNIKAIARRTVPSKRSQEKAAALSLHRIPYGVAIFFGASWAIAARYFVFFRL